MTSSSSIHHGLNEQLRSILALRSRAIYGALALLLMIVGLALFPGRDAFLTLIPFMVGAVTFSASSFGLYMRFRSDIPAIRQDISESAIESVSGSLDYVPQGGILKFALVEIGDRFYRTAIIHHLRIAHGTNVTARIGRRSRFIAELSGHSVHELQIVPHPIFSHIRVKAVVTSFLCLLASFVSGISATHFPLDKQVMVYVVSMAFSLCGFIFFGYAFWPQKKGRA